MAQIGSGYPDLPRETTTASAIQPSQLDEIKRLVAAGVADIQSQDPEARRRGRTALQRPVSTVDTSVAFRAAYSDVLVPELEAIVKGPAEVSAIIALQVAGDVATDRATSLLELGRASDKDAVRFAAVFGIGRVFRAAYTAAPAITPDRCLELVERLRVGLTQEKNPQVADVYVRSLIGAAREGAAQPLQGVRAVAMEKLVSAVGERVQKLSSKPEDLELFPAFIRAAEFARDAIASDVARRTLPEGVVRQAGGLGGDLVAFAFREIRAGSAFPSIAEGDDQEAQNAKLAKRRPCVDGVALGETLAFLAKDWFRSGAVGQSLGLSQHVARGTRQSDEAFLRLTPELVGDGRLLTTAPFGFAPTRFLR